MTTELATKHIPAHYIVLMLTNGILVLFLTPIHFFVPWINPTFQEATPEVLGTIALAILFSIFIGFPGFMLRDKFLGNSGLNARLKAFLFGKKISAEKEREQLISTIRFFLFAKKVGLSSLLSFLEVKSALISGLIVGSEIALIVNLLFLVLSVIINLELTLIIFLIIISLISFGIFWATRLYDHYYFKPNYELHLRVINKLYTDWQIEQRLNQKIAN